MNNNIVQGIATVVGIGALLLGVGYVANLQGSNTIVLTEQGFSPREITITLGETVTFINKRDKFFWPASDFHPTHTAYAEFDAREALSPGSSWKFTFTESGLFKYHDHLAPFFFGIIQVKNEEGEIVDRCEDRGGDLACWQDQIFIALAEKGISGAYDMISKLYESQPTFAQSCHFIAHNIGLASYGFYRENPQSVMSPKASTCASGFYHGFMEAYLGATGDVAKASATCDEIGSVLSLSAPDARFQCYHGIGHGTLEQSIGGKGTFGNLNDMVNGALLQCEEASQGEEERFRCASGIFNGIANFYINGEYGLDPFKENPLRLCARQKGIYQEACYGNMNSVLYWMTDNNFVEATRRALDGVNDSQVDTVVTYLAGLYAFDSLPSINTKEVLERCRELAPHTLLCIEGFTHGLLEHGPPETEYETALTFCSYIGFSPDERNTCYSEALSELPGWYSAEKTQEICNNLTPNLQHYCKE